jgi:hypothetical protein
MNAIEGLLVADTLEWEKFRFKYLYARGDQHFTFVEAH